MQAEDFEAAAGHSADLDAAKQELQKLQHDLRLAEGQLAAMVSPEHVIPQILESPSIGTTRYWGFEVRVWPSRWCRSCSTACVLRLAEGQLAAMAGRITHLVVRGWCFYSRTLMDPPDTG